MSDDDYMAVQRRNFEAQFGSLETLGFEDKSKRRSTAHVRDNRDEAEGDEAESDEMSFGGFSDSDDSGSESPESDSESQSEEEPAPKIIRLDDNFSTAPVITKKDQKLLRSGRAPTMAEIEEKNRKLEKISAKQAQQNKKEDEDNLENDMKLQRLLQESHILSNQLQFSGADLTLLTIDYEEPTGKARKKALTSRIRNLASTNSSTEGLPKTLEKMPMSMRKGMIKSRDRKVAKYEQEAKDAGIILSKVKKGELRQLDHGRGSTFASDRLGSGKKDTKRVRDRGLQINSVGRSTRNGLVISKDEISRINSQGKTQERKGKKRGRR